MSIVSVKNLSKKYGKTEILKDLNFSVAKNEHLSIIGPSGCGKTTLLRIIAGLEVPDTGEVYINEKVVTSSKLVVEPYKRNIGFVFQTPALWPHMTVEQNIMFGLESYSKNDAIDRINELLECTAITHLAKRYPDEISGGEAKRVSIARSLAPRPICLLMDEPLTNLDSQLKESVLQYLMDEIQKTKTTLIYVTHDQDEADRISKNKLYFDPKR